MTLSKDEIVRKEIIEKAQQLFKQFGLKKTTMDEIAVACGKAKSTLYHYFKSKEEVFDAVIDKEMTSLRRIVKENVDASKSLTDKMITYFLSFHKEVMAKINLYRVVKHELLTESVAQQYFHRLMSYEKSYLTRMLEDSRDAGEFSSIAKEDIPWTAELMLASFMGIVRYSIESDEGFDHDKLERSALALIPKIFT